VDDEAHVCDRGISTQSNFLIIREEPSDFDDRDVREEQDSEEDGHDDKEEEGEGKDEADGEQGTLASDSKGDDDEPMIPPPDAAAAVVEDLFSGGTFSLSIDERAGRVSER